jgi:hypothetical protein
MRTEKLPFLKLVRTRRISRLSTTSVLNLSTFRSLVLMEMSLLKRQAEELSSEVFSRLKKNTHESFGGQLEIGLEF